MDSIPAKQQAVESTQPSSTQESDLYPPYLNVSAYSPRALDVIRRSWKVEKQVQAWMDAHPEELAEFHKKVLACRAKRLAKQNSAGNVQGDATGMA